MNTLKNNRTAGIALASLFTLTAGTQQIEAAPVTWTTDATTLVDENDIDLTGTLVHAGTWGSTARIVAVGTETITFENRGLLPAGTTDGVVGVNGFSEFTSGDAFAPPGAIDAGFEAVMDGFSSGVINLGAVLTVTFDGLTPGQAYQVQLFVSDDRPSNASNVHTWQDQFDGSGNNTSTFTNDSSSYVIGTFTADGPTQQVFQVSSASSNTFNAYVLRQVPEPSSLVALGFLGLSMLHRRLPNRVTRD